MYRTLISKATSLVAGAALASALLAFHAAPALGASITINDNNCSSFTASGGGGALTINCTGGGGQSCSITSSVGTVISPLGTPTTLTANCTGSPTSWTWSASGQNSGNCPGNNNSGASQMALNGASVAVSNCVYQVDVNGGLGAATATIALQWTAGGGSPPANCSLSPPSQTVTSGGIATINAQCTGGTFPITHTLSSGGAFNGQSATQTSALVPATFTATVSAATTVTGSASNGQSTSDGSATISIGGGGGGLANCTAQGYSVVGGGAIGLQFATAQGGNSGSSFNDTTAWVLQVTVPTGTSNTSTQGQFVVTENGGQGTPRNIVISKTPCDFNRSKDYLGNAGPIAVCRNGTTCTALFQVGTPIPFGDTGWMQAGQTYFISVRNYSDFPLPNGSPSCGLSNCPAVYTYQPTR